MGASAYDENFLTDEQRRKIDEFKAAWEEASKRGDQAGMDSAHAAAERIRAEANYSGGADGGQYINLGKRAAGEDVYSPSVMPRYTAQTDAVNGLYDAAMEAKLAQLRGAYEASDAELRAQRDVIPKIYQQQKNAVAAQSETAGKNFNEYAAASGLNSGAGGQAKLAMGNQLQGELSELGAREADASRELENDIAQLKIQYQNDIAAAVAEGEYKRAAELLNEYRRQEESRVSAASAQADENYRAWQSGYQQRRDQVGDSQWQQQFDYTKEQNDYQRQYEEWERKLKEAQLWAQYGDYSGLRGLGVNVPEYGLQPVRPGVSTQSVRSSGSDGDIGDTTVYETDDWDISGGVLKTGSPAHTLYGLITNTPMDYNEILDRIAAGVKSGQISESAGDYLMNRITLWRE